MCQLTSEISNHTRQASQLNESSIIYCDESGNDGPNYLNPDEPFYVLAGWVVPESSAVDASVEIEKLRQARCPSASELKFRMFRKKPQAIYESMSRLGKIGLVPMYIVAEKRYCVAGKIIETFLDPYFNSAIAFPFTGDIFTKQELANTLYERLSDAYGAMRMSDGLIASGVTRDDAVAKLTALMHQGVLQSK